MYHVIHKDWFFTFGRPGTGTRPYYLLVLVFMYQICSVNTVATTWDESFDGWFKTSYIVLDSRAKYFMNFHFEIHGSFHLPKIFSKLLIFNKIDAFFQSSAQKSTNNRQPYWTTLLDSLIEQPYWTALLDNLIS